MNETEFDIEIALVDTCWSLKAPGAGPSLSPNDFAVTGVVDLRRSSATCRSGRRADWVIFAFYVFQGTKEFPCEGSELRDGSCDELPRTLQAIELA